MSEPSFVSPAPWDLSGMGLMCVFWGPKRIDPYSGVAVSGIGAMMIVQYEKSPVGAYNELLYIPGKQKIGNTEGYFISKIYVDSRASTESGRANWGIPKEMATLKIENLDERTTSFRGINDNGEMFLHLSFAARGFSFPVTTSLLPIKLVQHLNQKNYATKFVGKGRGRLSSLDIHNCDESFFPDITKFTVLACVKVRPFALTFPVPSTITV